MDDHDFKTVRRNFNILSVLILLLAYSNAEINQINFLGIDIELEGEKVYIGLFILYSYFIWRFLTKLPYRSGFLNDYHHYLLGENGIKSDFMKEKVFNKLKNDDSDKLAFLNLKRRSPKSLRYIDFEWTFQHWKFHEDYQIIEEVSLSRFYLLRKYLWFCFKYDKFGDYLFPFIPLIANLSFFFFDSDWQGGINKIL